MRRCCLRTSRWGGRRRCYSPSPSHDLSPGPNPNLNLNPNPNPNPDQVLAVSLDAARSLKELRELLADSYLEVFDVELLGPKMVIELEDQTGCFVRVGDSAPIKAGRLLTALSIHVTASVR